MHIITCSLQKTDQLINSEIAKQFVGNNETILKSLTGFEDIKNYLEWQLCISEKQKDTLIYKNHINWLIFEKSIFNVTDKVM